MARRSPYRLILATALALILVMLPAGGILAAGDRVLVASHKSTIDISLTYEGDQIVFFGLNPDPEDDLVVKLVSQAKGEVLLSVKDRFGPVWMAMRQYRVSGAPLMYKIISRVPLNELMTPEQADKLGLGYASLERHLKVELVRGEPVAGERKRVVEALIRLKEAQGLYHVYSHPGRLQMMEGKLYSHYFSFPAAAGEGMYTAETYALRKGRVVGFGRTEVTIRKVGLQAWITEAAQRTPLWYGLGSVFLAALLGLAVGLIFKRGGNH
jgi:uncharacterized protein (TIGR02186 family)